MDELATAVVDLLVQRPQVAVMRAIDVLQVAVQDADGVVALPSVEMPAGRADLRVNRVAVLFEGGLQRLPSRLQLATERPIGVLERIQVMAAADVSRLGRRRGSVG